MTDKIPRETLEVRGDPAAHLSLNSGGHRLIQRLQLGVTASPRLRRPRPGTHLTPRHTGSVENLTERRTGFRGPGR